MKTNIALALVLIMRTTSLISCSDNEQPQNESTAQNIVATTDDTKSDSILLDKPNPVALAELLIKDNQNDDDKLVTAYLDSLGFKETNKFVGKYLFDGREIQIYAAIQKNKDNSRYVCIESNDHSFIWWMKIRLQDYGLKETFGSNSRYNLEGNGIYAMIHNNSPRYHDKYYPNTLTTLIISTEPISR